MSASSPLPRPFGPYVLTRALGSDPLGAVFRAGVPSPSGLGMRSFLHIREFSGAAVDRTALLLAMENAIDAVEEIKGASVARGAVMGAIDDTPFLGVEYVPGRTLDTVFASREAGAVFPVEHGLLIAEKILVAFEAAESLKKLTGAPHGFLIPAFVFISNDGETRVFGGGLASGLLPALRIPRARSAFLPYIAPEVLESGRPSPAGDLYSAAVILFETLTGRLPAGPDPLSTATLAIDGTPMPEDVRQLLRRALHPDPARRDHLVVFRKELGNLLYGGPYSPSTFNLAFFMQRHFEKAILQEKAEIELEEHVDATLIGTPLPAVHAPSPAPAPPPARRHDGDASGGRRPTDGVPRVTPLDGSGGRRPPSESSGQRTMESSGPKRPPEPGPPRRPPLETSSARIPPAPVRPPDRMARTGSATRVLPERQKKPRLAGVPLWAAAAAVVVLGVGAFFAVEWRQRTTAPVPTPAPLPTPLPPTPVPTPEPVVVGKDDPLFQAAVEKGVQEEVKKTEKKIAKDQENLARKKKAEVDKTTDETGKAKDSEDVARAAREHADRDEAAKLARDARDARKRDEAAKAAAVAAEQAAPKTKEGDTVDADALDTPPTLVKTVKPEASPLALRRRINGTVLLRVLVDENGHAERVDLLRDTAERVGLGESCVRALKQWIWTPPVKDGKKVKTWIPVQVPFKLG